MKLNEKIRVQDTRVGGRGMERIRKKIRAEKWKGK